MKIRFLREVHTQKQRRYMCAMKKPGADRPKDLEQDEAEEMCTGPMKEEQIEETSAAGGAAPAVSGGGRPPDDDPIEEMYSTSSQHNRGRWRGPPVDEFAGYKERAAYQKLKNVPRPRRRLKIRFKR